MTGKQMPTTTITTTMKRLPQFRQRRVYLLPFAIVVAISGVGKSPASAQRIYRDLSCNATLEFTYATNNSTNATSECEPYLENGRCDSELGWDPKIPECERADCDDCNYFCEELSYDCGECLSNGCYWCPGDGTCHNSDLYYAHLTPTEDDPSGSSDRRYSCYKSEDYIRTGVLVLGQEDEEQGSSTIRSSTTRTVSSIEAIEEQCTKPENHFT